MKLRHLSFAALALIAASCTNDNEPGTAGFDLTGQPMRVTTDVLPQTRAGMDGNNLTTFYLRVTNVTNVSDDATTSYDEFTTVSRTDVNSSWTYDPELTWKDGTTPISVSALCQDGVTWDKTAYTTGKDIDISDQKTEAGIKTADVLYMDATPIDPANDLQDGAIPVKLSHCFAKLHITIQVNSTAASNPITPLTVGDTKATATFIPETNTLTLTGEATPIQAYQASYTAGANPTPATATYECIVLPQTAQFTVTATIDGTDYTYTHPTALTFAGNTQYNLALEVSGIDYTMTVADNIDVSGWGEEDLEGGSMNEDLGYTLANDGKTYQVHNAKGLMAWVTALQNNNSLNCTLTADIDLSEQTWPEVANHSTFDGQGHTISGLTGEYGLINLNNGTIKNVTLLQPNLKCEDYEVGGIATINYGYIYNCHVIDGSISTSIDRGNAGGIACRNQRGEMFACSSTAKVDAKDAAGGLVGLISGGSITACYYANGTVTGGNYIGSIVGDNGSGTISACYWSGGAAQGVGEGTGETTQVTDDITWEAAVAAMNTALEAARYTEYKWVVNEGPNAASRPLITQEVTE